MQKTKAHEIAEELLREHAALRVEWAQIENRVREVIPESASDATVWRILVEPLTHMRETLGHHFALEEEGGYLRGVGDHHPGTEREAGELVGEHKALFSRLTELVQTLEGHVQAGTAPGEAFVIGLGELQRDLRDHETRENDLFQRLVTMDIGGRG